MSYIILKETGLGPETFEETGWSPRTKEDLEEIMDVLIKEFLDNQGGYTTVREFEGDTEECAAEMFYIFEETEKVGEEDTTEFLARMFQKYDNKEKKGEDQDHNSELYRQYLRLKRIFEP